MLVFDKEKKVMTHSRELELNLPFKCTKYIDKTPIVACEVEFIVYGMMFG